jgi:lipopolysaccharide transport protein LptA
MEAPRLRYTRADGLVHGTGGVRARLDEADESALGGSPLARGDGPVWVEAEEGSFREQPRAFSFQGKVRAWRGDDLLVANELRGDEPEDRLVATGAVRTLWVPEEDGAEEGDPAGAGAPLEVRSRELVYRKSARLLVYTGEVVARQEERTLACREMEVELAEEGGVAELRCAGDARVEDPLEGRTLRGERLRYRPDERVVEVTAAEGEKVRMRDREGNVIEGARMTYDVETGRVQVFGRAGETAPAPSPAPAGEGGRGR